MGDNPLAKARGLSPCAGKQTIYTQIQKKPISHFSGQLWKSELRNENICIPYLVAISLASFHLIMQQFYLNLPNAIRQCLDKGSFSEMTSFSLENEYLVLV